MSAQYPNDADGQALARLAASGVDLTEEALVEFAIDVPDEVTAHKVANLIPKAYATELYYDEGETEYKQGVDDVEFGPSWTVYAKRRAVPTYEFLLASQAELHECVLPAGGKLDGWGIEF